MASSSPHSEPRRSRYRTIREERICSNRHFKIPKGATHLDLYNPRWSTDYRGSTFISVTWTSERDHEYSPSRALERSRSRSRSRERVERVEPVEIAVAVPTVSSIDFDTYNTRINPIRSEIEMVKQLLKIRSITVPKMESPKIQWWTTEQHCETMIAAMKQQLTTLNSYLVSGGVPMSPIGEQAIASFNT